MDEVLGCLRARLEKKYPIGYHDTLFRILKMPTLYVLILILGLAVSGCQGVFSPSPESQVDQELSQVRVPTDPPESGPGAPQKGFEQEVEKAQNL